ncbi:hypothetical protein BN1708_004122 [Verticillium longisporum]|uniref:Ribose-5-phosphate isomerase n=1 Tax=Verticillium longisporum TaxID=100787 RepID=A0A0G4LVJ8_VERLO|nr:hypothetical protein BN1708_004122 [Verticillium longisporum]
MFRLVRPSFFCPQATITNKIPLPFLPRLHFAPEAASTAARTMSTLSPVESAKKAAAARAVSEHLQPSHRYPVTLDVAFDGADEVDAELNCIKGGGACLLQEKLVAIAAKKFVVVADYRKLSKNLLTQWKAIPIEVLPMAAPDVLNQLVALGSTGPLVRPGVPGKAGEVVTDNGMWIIDAPFAPLKLLSEGAGAERAADGSWGVKALADEIVKIPGVVEVGIFFGLDGSEAAKVGKFGLAQKPVAAYFGMEDGSVKVTNAAGSE